MSFVACTAPPRGGCDTTKEGSHQRLLLSPGIPSSCLFFCQIKAYLWHQQPYISRFNEDGKKSKSKGNHVWHIFARKEQNGTRWVFRAFERKIVGNPAPIAYVGLKWAWQPRIWDPQMSRQSIAVVWSSPALPPWLSWHKDLLIGVPGPGDATDVDIEIEASVRSW
jgi:hypothetical protein